MGSYSALSCRQELQGFGLRTQATAEDGSSHRTPHSLVARSSKGSDSALRQLPRTAVATGPRTLLSPGAPRVQTPHSGNCRPLGRPPAATRNRPTTSSGRVGRGLPPYGLMVTGIAQPAGGCRRAANPSSGLAAPSPSGRAGMRNL